MGISDTSCDTGLSGVLPKIRHTSGLYLGSMLVDCYGVCTCGVKMATESSLPKGWMERKSTSKDKVYYYNEYTKMTQWEKPLSPAPGQVSAAHARVL